MRSRLCLGVSALACSVGCAIFGSPPPPCESVPFMVVVTGGEMQNLNPDGQAMPVEVRALFLQERKLFDELDFNALYERGKAAVGGDVLADMSFTVFPKEEKATPIQVPPATRYLALVAHFRQPEEQRWRQVVDLSAPVARCKPGELHTQVRAQIFDNRLTAPERVD